MDTNIYLISYFLKQNSDDVKKYYLISVQHP